MDSLQSNNSSILCEMSKLISNRYELKIIYYTECILGLLALFPNLLTLNLLWRVKIFHANLRLIFANLTCNLIFYSLTMLIKAFQRLTGNPCDFPSPIQLCIVKDLVVIIPIQNALLSVVILSLERLYATIRYRSYDYAKSSAPYLGVFLIACTWTTTLVLNIPGLLGSPAHIWTPICETALVGNSISVANSLISLLIFEAMAVGLTIFVFFYNRYISGHMAINRAMYNLSSRFQVNQNVQLNKALIPGIVLHVLCHIPSYAFLCAVFVGGVGMEISTKVWLLHLTFVWRLVYALIDPILMMILNPNLRQGFKKSAVGRLFLSIYYYFVSRKITKPREPCQEREKVMNAHFDYLEEMWAVQK